MTYVDVILIALLAAAVTVAIAVPRYRQAALGAAAVLASVFGARRLAAWLGRDETPVADEEPQPPKHTANEHEQQTADDEADAVVAAADEHEVPVDVVEDDLAWLDEWREEK